MNAQFVRELDMFIRTDRYIVDRPFVPPIVRATTAHTSLTASITALKAAAQLQIGGADQAEAGVDLRVLNAQLLRDFLKDLNRSARRLESEHPGLRPTFRLPKAGSYATLIAKAQEVIDVATPLSAAFVEIGVAATFLTDLQALLTALEEATGRKGGGQIDRAQGTARLKLIARQGLEAARDLDACVRNHYKNQPDQLAAWAVARHIERAPRRNKEENPPDGTGSGDGSGGSSTLALAGPNGGTQTA